MATIFPDGTYYSCTDPEVLTCTEPEEALEQYLDADLNPKMTVAEVIASIRAPPAERETTPTPCAECGGSGYVTPAGARPVVGFPLPVPCPRCAPRVAGAGREAERPPLLRFCPGGPGHAHTPTALVEAADCPACRREESIRGS